MHDDLCLNKLVHTVPESDLVKYRAGYCQAAVEWHEPRSP